MQEIVVRGMAKQAHMLVYSVQTEHTHNICFSDNVWLPTQRLVCDPDSFAFWFAQ